MEQIIANLVKVIGFCAIAFGYIWVAKKLADARTKSFNDDNEIEENSNKAVGFRRAGLYVAIGIALVGTLSGTSQGLMEDVISLAIDGAVILVCLFACRALNDNIMLGHIDNDQEAKNGNSAVGLAECGMYMATGFILNGSLSGDGSGGIIAGVIGTVVFFAVGQALLLLFGLCYEKITPYNVRDEIKKDNPAAGLALAIMLVALGIILRASIAGPSSGWIQDFKGFGISAGYGIILLLVFRKMIDIFLLPNTNLETEIKRDQNVAAIAVTGSAILAVALIISSVV
jgi:uncharacterized membrane protein YjfL (UPF0719 family)